MLKVLTINLLSVTRLFLPVKSKSVNLTVFSARMYIFFKVMYGVPPTC